MSTRTIAVDFDGVLHAFTTPWSADHVISDGPVPGAIEWLREMRQRFNVVIYTARGRSIEGQLAVCRWLDQHGFGKDSFSIMVTAQKPAAIVFIDDRGFRFEGAFPTAEEILRLVPWNRR